MLKPPGRRTRGGVAENVTFQQAPGAADAPGLRATLACKMLLPDSARGRRGSGKRRLLTSQDKGR